MGQWGFFFVRGAPVGPAKGVKNLGMKFCFGIVRPEIAPSLCIFTSSPAMRLDAPDSATVATVLSDSLGDSEWKSATVATDISNSWYARACARARVRLR
jgi:hypothetical protein